MIKKVMAAGVLGGIIFMSAPALAQLTDVPQQEKVIAISATEKLGIKVTTHEVQQNEGYFVNNMRVPVISGLKNIELQQQLNKNIMEQATKIKTELAQQAKEYAEDCKKYGWEVRPYHLELDYKVFSDQNILSVGVTTYWYTGGANGMHETTYYNVDTEQGKLLTLKDIFKEDVDYKALINKEINKQIADHKKQGSMTFFDNEMAFKSIADNQSFYIEDGNVAVTFGLYEIAPRVAGTPTFYLNTSKLKEFLKDDFCKKANVTSYDLIKQKEYGQVSIAYPQLKNFNEEPLADNINQDLADTLKPYLEELKPDAQFDVDYEVTERTEQRLSVVFRGEQDYEGGKHAVLVGKTFDLATGNQITAANVIKNDQESRKAVNKLLQQAAKENQQLKSPFPGFGEWMGMYFTDGELVFYYQENDHTTDFVELALPLEKVKPYLNTEFGQQTTSQK